MIKGIITDILRASVSDGPGIRTTVFLKGCPLNCAWCHNPETKRPQPQLWFSSEKCIGCGRCVPACPEHLHSLEEGIHHVSFARCRACGSCVSSCPVKALKFVGKEITLAECLDIVVRDLNFYENSGGGVTVSGGEPSFQPDFTLALLQCLKSREIHTCLDTCGYAGTDFFRKILPFTNLFLFDFKESKEERHVKYTGKSNRLILKNLDWLCSHGAAVRLRCPIIPGVNDREDHLDEIKRLCASYHIDYEIMPYHDMGKSKAKAIGLNQEY